MKSKRNIIIIATGIGIIVILCVILICIVIANKNKDDKEEYRNIKISEISGEVQVERTNTGTLEAYAGMMLQSEDIITTGKQGYLYLKMDDDKYVLMEPESKARIVASGDKKDSKTSIYLEEGSIVNRIDEDLSKDSVYEINTPNSTMAVRGTNFRVEIRYKDGASYTNVEVFEGTVDCQLVFPDGSVDGKRVSGSAGNMIQIRGDDKDSVYIVIDGTIDYEALPVETLKFLEAVMKAGVPLSISEDELSNIIDKKEQEHGEEITTENPETTSNPETASEQETTSAQSYVSTTTKQEVEETTEKEQISEKATTSKKSSGSKKSKKKKSEKTTTPETTKVAEETASAIETTTKKEIITQKETSASEETTAPKETTAPEETPMQEETPTLEEIIPEETTQEKSYPADSA